MPPAKKAPAKKATTKKAPAKKPPPKKPARKPAPVRAPKKAAARKPAPAPAPKKAAARKPAPAPKKAAAPKIVTAPAKKAPPLESLDFLKVESILDHPNGSATIDAMLNERMRAWNQRDKSNDWSARRSAATQWQLCYCGTPFRGLTLKGQHVISRDVALGGEPGGRVHTWSTEIGKRINVATLKGVIERMLS